MATNHEAHKRTGIAYADSIVETRRLAAEVGLFVREGKGSDRWAAHATAEVHGPTSHIVFTASNQMSFRQKVTTYKQGRQSVLGAHAGAWWEVDTDQSDRSDIKVTNATLAQSVLLMMAKAPEYEYQYLPKPIFRLWYCRSPEHRVLCITVKPGGTVCYKEEFDRCLQEWATQS